MENRQRLNPEALQRVTAQRCESLGAADGIYNSSILDDVYIVISSGIKGQRSKNVVYL